MIKQTEFVRVMGFVAVMIVVNTGVLGMEVKRGEKVNLFDEKSGLKDVNKVILYEASSNCENRTSVISIYCSSKEKEFGCKAVNSSTILLQTENNSVSLTLLDASKAGCYVVEITSNTVVEKHVVVKESPKTAEAWTISLIFAVGIAVLAVGILAIIRVINCIYQKVKMTQMIPTRWWTSRAFAWLIW
ncbi:hypothetical protein G5714_022274 [Onychostoma macrolepis]|uniref:Uncharacterized protein n=1 Tax=Onychostoma macrolepis TaxID=369639 RepID=A0A7J6BPU8_9TELE|nr:hypothetical protein G5714_022274 [Onychostoma macrolepis]